MITAQHAGHKAKRRLRSQRLWYGPCHKQILGQTYEKLRIRSDLGTSEENLTLNLRKTYDQRNTHSFGSANYSLHLQIFPATLLRKLPVTASAHPHFTPGRYGYLPFP